MIGERIKNILYDLHGVDEEAFKKDRDRGF